MKIKIHIERLNPAVRAMAIDARPTLVVAAAPLPSVREGLLGWWLSRALGTSIPHQNFIWVGPRCEAMRTAVEVWLAGSPVELMLGTKAEHPHSLRHNDARLWFLRPERAFQLEPAGGVADAVLEDCEATADPSTWLAMNAKGNVRMVGSQPLDSRHWFAQAINAARQLSPEDPKTGFHFIAITDDVRHGRLTPEQAAALKAGDPDSFGRVYLLQQTAAPVGPVDSASRGPSVLTSFSRFARERLWIRPKLGQPIQFRVNSVQRYYEGARRLSRQRGHPAKYLLLKYRRGGFTTWEQGRNYQTICEVPYSQVVTLAHTDDATQRIFRIAQLFHEKDPHAPDLRGVGNARRLEFIQQHSMFFIGTAGSSGFGRGDTLQRVHGSEVAWWCRGPHQADDVEQLVAGLTEASSHGEITLETTPNGLDWFASIYKEAKEGLNDWTPIFLPWFFDETNTLAPTEFNAEEVLATLAEDEKALIEQYNLTTGQVAWRRMKRRALKGLFKQEYPEDDISCFLATGHCYFDIQIISALVDALQLRPAPLVSRRDIKKSDSGRAVELMWERPVPGERYCLGADTSEGKPGCDPNGLVVLKRSSGVPVCDIHGLMDPAMLADECVRVHRLYNNAIMGIEENNHGHAVLQRVRTVHNVRESRFLYHHGIGKARKPGWSTDAISRPIMLDELCEAVESGAVEERDVEFLSECLTFRMQRNAKFGADSGAHDDRVIKRAIAWQMRKARVSVPAMGVAEML